MNTIIQKAKETHELSRDEIIALLKDDSINDELFKAADEVRKKYLGDEVHLRGLIEFTNICKRNCMYCGLRRDNKNLNRYRLSHEEIIDFAKKAVGYGYKTLVLQGGEDDYYTVERLVPIVKDLKALGVALTLSIGERPFEEYEALKKAGADRFLLRIETTDRELYEELDPGMSHENRIQCLKNLRKLGYEVGSGCLVGLPGQKIESLADDILFFKELDVDMNGIGPFIPNEDTPLKDAEGGQFELALKVMAIVRLLLPDINIPATTAMETLNKQGRVIALQCGANVVMPNVTEGEYRKLYALYPGKICTGDTPAHCRGCISGKIRGIGRIVSDGPGFRANGFKTKTR
ncbi:[FeFe] hydrogenase H-cluster radical SAM maturase HydE [Clostridium perfringens]|uniref:[FeFe] hydrogenase H-cluster radical SAM maturase HydE n=1 Tax=Clostridium perfringens TaxID=1502 RepID=A0AAP8XDB8_CLOPF|nr:MULTISPECIES: [FeFe] hydrogenase H-cluster radical SAM maturase HydE [Clostridium]AMN33950.1 biotin synthase [Clostridium perfringens]AQW28074.1 [FeFe] hydrogenase H-cluster radical SAM maturase HydE [Clostridium perfringens]ASY52761.1 [FeFe] hydrogenase H-cluster radical SAM maturase HydE [Clostridium perfringens]AWS24344.1 [FeFe] hydrogenase H-cluster radical SAM maturase HydE [Clostridium perfringens]EGT0684496.1 [FeFe] hydrogenase H-cluster radical SAM maturase HydE [Clostridium perfrin